MSPSEPSPPDAEPRNRRGLGGLVAIVVGIVLGGLVGALYGRSIWLASGGPQSLVEELSAIREQKAEFAEREAELADAATDPEQVAAHREEATRLREQIPTIEERLAEVEQLAFQAEADADLPHSERAYVIGRIIRFCGDLFLRMLFLLVIPLVVTSMISGITALGDIRKVGRLGLWTVVYYVTTTSVAVLIGILLVEAIEPGRGADDTFAFVTGAVAEKERESTLDTMLSVVIGREGEPGGGMFPRNIFVAAVDMNVLGLIVFSLVFGGALTTLGPVGQPVIDFFAAANQAVMKMVHLVMYLAPVGIFGLVAWQITKSGGGEAFVEQFTRLAQYAMTVLAGLAIHAVFLGVLLALLAGRNPWRYTLNMLRALLTAMSTASSSATLPLTMECVERNNGVSNRTASFVLPLGATINMDGTALYEAVAAIFIAQSLGIELTTAQLVIIFLTATLAAIGAAGIPEAGLVTMVIVLTAVGLPATGIGTILAIDWFLDRMRTTVNVYGDSIGAAIIDRRVVRGTP